MLKSPVIVEGYLIIFTGHPLKVHLKSPVIIGGLKLVLIISNQRTIKDSGIFQLLLRNIKIFLKVLSSTPTFCLLNVHYY